MTEASLQANTPSSTWARQVHIPGRAQLSQRFQVTTAGFVKAVGWYQTALGDAKPNKLSLYAAGVGVWSLTAVPEDGTVPGWQYYTLPVKIELQPGTTYAVAMDTVSPTGSTFGAPADHYDPPLPFLKDDAESHTGTLLYPTYPNQARADQFLALDVIWEDISHIDDRPPTGQVNVPEALADWFDLEDATKPTGDPGLYPRVAQKLDLTNFVDLVDQIQFIWNVAGDLADLEIAAVNALTAKLKEWLGWTADNDTALRRPDGTTVLDDTQGLITGQNALDDKLNTIIAKLDTLLAGQSRWEGAVGAFPVGWSLLAETEWDHTLAWDEPAHLYVVTITAWPDGWSRFDLGALTWLPRAGWWATLNGTQVGERSYFDLTTQQLHKEGRAMPGIVLWSHPGFSGTIQAWGAP